MEIYREKRRVSSLINTALLISQTGCLRPLITRNYVAGILLLTSIVYYIIHNNNLRIRFYNNIHIT